MTDKAESTSPPQQPEVADCPPDTVQLFQFTNGYTAPSTSPFVIKIETYLRLAKIPYQNDRSNQFSPKTGKCPWIRYNGKDVPDSTVIIDFLNTERGVDLNKGLSVEQRAVCTAFERMVDEHLFWILVYTKFEREEGYKASLPFFIDAVGAELTKVISANYKSYLQGQGMGRHDENTVFKFAESAIKALSDYLGDKQFMMGDQPTQVDCSVFGSMVQFIWNTNDNWMEKLIPEKFPNLIQYCERMKARVWPDWDQLLRVPGGGKS